MSAINSEELLKTELEEKPFLSLSDAVYNVLFRKIIQRDFDVSKKLNISAIADEMRISRTPLVNAMGRLEQDGIVYAVKNKGTFIASFSEELYTKVHTLRNKLEIDAIRKTAERITVGQLKTLNIFCKNLRDAYESGDIRVIIDSETKFHSAIVSWCENPYLIRAYTELQPHVMRYQYFVLAKPGNVKGIIEQHNFIYKALLHRDSSCCADAMLSHLKTVPVLSVKIESAYTRREPSYREA